MTQVAIDSPIMHKQFLLSVSFTVVSFSSSGSVFRLSILES